MTNESILGQLYGFEEVDESRALAMLWTLWIRRQRHPLEIHLRPDTVIMVKARYPAPLGSRLMRANEGVPKGKAWVKWNE